MTGLALFDLPHNGTPTSRAAAESIENAETLRRRVYYFIASRGRHGATDDEIQTALALSGNTERPRRWELAKGGRIVASPDTRKTLSGRSAVVWVAS